MDHRRLIPQPTASNKLFCGWTSFTYRPIQFVRNGSLALRGKIKVDRWLPCHLYQSALSLVDQRYDLFCPL
jgi:hypothetical protein